MRRHFLQLEPHQQLLTAGSAAAVVVLLAAVVLAQLHRSQQQAERQLAQTTAELVQVKALAVQFTALHADDKKTDEPVDMMAEVSRSLQAFGLQPTRIQQGAADELQLRVDAVPYADAISWLAALEQRGKVVLLRATFTQGPNESTNLTVSLKNHP